MSEFPFEYMGGGHWRAKGVSKGEKAETLHGEEAVCSALAHARDVALEEAAQVAEKLRKRCVGTTSVAAAWILARDIRALKRGGA